MTDLERELLEALERLRNACNGEVAEVFGGEVGAELDNADAAIAKAKGGAA